VKDPLEDAGVDVDRRGVRNLFLVILFGVLVLFVARPSSRYGLLIILGIVAMVMLHEAGHFYVAKRAGMKATEFFVGFGPRLWSFRRGETEYGVKAILLGGDVRAGGISIVWIEHVVHALLATVDRLLVLHGGKFIAEGDPRSVIKSPQVAEIYMGIAADA